MNHFLTHFRNTETNTMGNTKTKENTQNNVRYAPTTPTPTPLLNSLISIRETIERQKKRIKLFEKKSIQAARLALQKRKAGDKKGAIMNMRRKKMYEREIAKLEATQLTLEQQCFSIESAKANIDVVAAITEGANQMKKMNGALNVDNVADLRDDIEEQQQMGDEVSNLLSEGIGFAGTIDEDELEAELAALSAEENTNEISAAMPIAPESSLVAPMPVVPTNAVTITTGDSDEAMLAQLQAEFA